MKFIKKLIKPLTRVVVAILAAIGAIGVAGLAVTAVRMPENRTIGEQETIDRLKSLVNH
jgi:hypothetical protein